MTELFLGSIFCKVYSKEPTSCFIDIWVSLYFISHNLVNKKNTPSLPKGRGSSSLPTKPSGRVWLQEMSKMGSAGKKDIIFCWQKIRLTTQDPRLTIHKGIHSSSSPAIASGRDPLTIQFLLHLQSLNRILQRTCCANNSDVPQINQGEAATVGSCIGRILAGCPF